LKFVYSILKHSKNYTHICTSFKRSS